MWRSSRSNRCGPARGFTLLEAMVSLLLLVIVLIVAMTMLFQMRAFAERQQYFMLPRQTARRAADYLSYYFAGASDVNYVDSKRPSPNALIMYYNLGGNLTQASYNNLTDAQTALGFGDVGTDIITMVTPFDPGRYQVFAPFVPGAPEYWFNFRVGCATDDTENMKAFKAATGDDGTTGSALLMLVDSSGSWSYVRITNYLGSACADPEFKNIHVTADTASATLPAPPNGVAGIVDFVYLVTGLQVISFRVLTDSVDGLPKLQQKLGLFDPNTDNPYPPIGSPLPRFTNVMENVEDLQIAYMYSQDLAAGASGPPTNSSLVWNTASQTLDSAGHVPLQAGPSGAPGAFDITNVIGVRVSVTGRSPLLPLAAQKLTNVDVKDPLMSQHFRPASEDHLVADPPQFDKFDHYRATATLLLRNRLPRS
jgi:type II secretory pathway pseudopilin PulG